MHPISPAQGKIQNSKSGVYWMCIAFRPSLVGAPRRGSTASRGPSVVPDLVLRRPLNHSPGHTHQRELRAEGSAPERAWEGGSGSFHRGPGLTHAQVTAVSSRVRHVSGALTTVSRPTESSPDCGSLSRG